jgi:DNA invertase Pin-like site-specific DNA recombinase
MKMRIKNKKDAWIGVSGDTGGGKSLFTLMFLALFGRRPCSLDYNVTYIPKGDEIVDKFNKLNKNVLIIDEAAKEMRSVNWQSKKQQRVNVKAMTDRFKSNVVFLNMPQFDEFTKSMRRGSIMFRCILVYRTATHARIILQRKSRNWRSDDPWGDKLANSLYESHENKRRLTITNETILEIERSIPNTVMDFMIPNLELILPDITAEYERLKIKSRENEKVEDTKQENKPNFYKNKYQLLLNKVSKILIDNRLEIGKVRVSRSTIARELGISSNLLKEYYTAPLIEDLNFRKSEDNK